VEKKISPKGEHHKLGYQERATNYINYAEQRFEEHCKQRGFKYSKLLLNDKEDFINSPIPFWSKLSPLLQGLPDYFFYGVSDNKPFQCFAEVKSSNRIKLKDFVKYCAFKSMFCENEAYTNYRIYFCFKDKIIAKSIDQILRIIPQSKLEKYPEGTEYFILPL